MLRLAKYTKPYLGMILLAIVLLFAQANFDLALPDYLSRIVNTGIQQGGVENAVPAALRQSALDRLLIFMNAADRTAVLDAYTLVDQNAADYDQYRQKYPGLAAEAVYVLKPGNPAPSDHLNLVMAKALLAVSGLEEALADPARAAQMSAGLGFDLSQLPAGMDLFALLKQAPADRLEALTSALNAKFAALGDKMIIQAAAKPIRAEYQALGLDTDRLQNDYLLATGGWMILLTLLSVACTIAVSYLSAQTAAGLARDLRRAVFQKVESFSSGEFDSFSTASLITRTTNDITQVQMVVMLIIRMVFYAPLMGIGGIIHVVGEDAAMSWLIGVAVL
nr:hypothetical protein [Anaerolineales bacterium]